MGVPEPPLGGITWTSHQIEVNPGLEQTTNKLCNRVRPRFFDQVGHQTTNASIGNKYFFTK